MSEIENIKAFLGCSPLQYAGMGSVEKPDKTSGVTSPIDIKIGQPADKEQEGLVSIKQSNEINNTLEKEIGIGIDDLVEAISKGQNLTPEQKLSLKTNLTEKLSDKNELNKFIKEQKVVVAKDLREKLDKIQSKQGWIGKGWNWTKNLFGMKTGSDKVQETIDKLENGEITVETATESLKNYYEGQQQVVDVVADSFSAVLAGLTYSLALGGAVAAPFTGGASLAVTAAAIGCATVVGAGTKVAVKQLDAWSGGREYTWKDCGKDALTGAINGPLACLTAGVGLVVAKGGAKLGLKAAQTAVSTMDNQIVVGFGKATTKNTILLAVQSAVKGTEVTINSAASNSAYREAGTFLFKNVSREQTKVLTAVAANATTNTPSIVLLPDSKTTFLSKLLFNTMDGSAKGATYAAGATAGAYTVETTIDDGEFNLKDFATASTVGGASGALFGGVLSGGGTLLVKGIKSLPKPFSSAKSSSKIIIDVTPENLQLPQAQLPVTTNVAKPASALLPTVLTKKAGSTIPASIAPTTVPQAGVAKVASALSTVLAKTNIKANEIATAVAPILNNYGAVFPAIPAAIASVTTTQAGITTASVIPALQAKTIETPANTQTDTIKLPDRTTLTEGSKYNKERMAEDLQCIDPEIAAAIRESGDLFTTEEIEAIETIQNSKEYPKTPLDMIIKSRGNTSVLKGITHIVENDVSYKLTGYINNYYTFQKTNSNSNGISTLKIDKLIHANSDLIPTKKGNELYRAINDPSEIDRLFSLADKKSASQTSTVIYRPGKLTSVSKDKKIVEKYARKNVYMEIRIPKKFKSTGIDVNKFFDNHNLTNKFNYQNEILLASDSEFEIIDISEDKENGKIIFILELK